MSKLLLGVILLVLWLWIGPENITWPELRRDEVNEETQPQSDSAEDRSEIGSSSEKTLVQYVIDGDTFEVEEGVRVRLLGIDTPERNECYSQEATDYLRTLIHGREVRLESDTTDKDKYDRLLRHTFLTIVEGGAEMHINLNLVREGYAEVLPIPPDRQYREELAAAEAAAKAARKGRWGVCVE